MLIRKPDEVIFTTYTRARFTADKYNIELPEVIGNVTDIPEKIKQMDLRRALDLNNGVKIALYQGGIQLGRGLEQLIDADLNNGVKIALYQGGIQLGRGLEQLIDAAPLLSPNIVLVLVGDGRLRPVLEARVETLNLSERVKFTGRVPLDELLGYTACADVGLQILQNMCFNHYSTDSNKLYEYLTVGVPVVASDFPEA
jgi:glycosyltransferase involved in cell wall biosynthesis